jgi:hypothetical protein
LISVSTIKDIKAVQAQSLKGRTAAVVIIGTAGANPVWLQHSSEGKPGGLMADALPTQLEGKVGARC